MLNIKKPFTWDNGVYGYYDNSGCHITGVNCFGYMKNSVLVIPDGVTSIEEAAFFDCLNLRKVIIPGTVKEIKDRAFSGCSDLKYIDMKEGVEHIGKFAFCGCSFIELQVPSSVKEVEYGSLASSVEKPVINFKGKPKGIISSILSKDNGGNKLYSVIEVGDKQFFFPYGITEESAKLIEADLDEDLALECTKNYYSAYITAHKLITKKGKGKGFAEKNFKNILKSFANMNHYSYLCDVLKNISISEDEMKAVEKTLEDHCVGKEGRKKILSCVCLKTAASRKNYVYGGSYMDKNGSIYMYKENGFCLIKASSFFIPDDISGIPIIEIRRGAFDTLDSKRCEEITIPKSVKFVDYGALGFDSIIRFEGTPAGFLGAVSGSHTTNFAEVIINSQNYLIPSGIPEDLALKYESSLLNFGEEEILGKSKNNFANIETAVELLRRKGKGKKFLKNNLCMVVEYLLVVKDYESFVMIINQIGYDDEMLPDLIQIIKEQGCDQEIINFVRKKVK